MSLPYENTVSESVFNTYNGYCNIVNLMSPNIMQVCINYGTITVKGFVNDYYYYYSIL